MSGPLILSVFPGIDLLGRAFEEEWPEACVVRGPDLLWDGDIRTFHPPAGRFDGVIGGPPCQAFSRLRHMVEANGYRVAENLIPEFERVARECAPSWFLMENVPGAPEPTVEGYVVRVSRVQDAHVGGETLRVRNFSWGRRDEAGGRYPALDIEWAALHVTEPEYAVCASGGSPVPVALVRDGKGGHRTKSGKVATGYKTADYLRMALRGQGLPPDFLAGAPFTVAGKIKCVGNGVPRAMGRAIARAVRRAVETS